MNFDIALKTYYRSRNCDPPRLDYNTLFKGVVNKIPNVDFLKAFIFAPEPDPFLMKDPMLLSYYKWIQGLKSSKYIDVIEGRYLGRPVNEAIPMDITDRNTYYKEEKGTDINLAIHALVKAYSNSYDVAYIMSADTDYISVYKQLKNLGKIVVLVVVKGQQFGKITPEVDDFVLLDDYFFSNHIRKPKNMIATID